MSSLTVLPPIDIAPLRGGPVLRWGVMAPGGIADAWVGTLHRNTDQRVVAVASRSLERGQAFATKHGIDTVYEGYEQLAADPGVDVVYIAAPHTEHRALALLAIAAGKHVLVEKPIGVSAAEAREIAAAARAAAVFAMEAMWTRFLPQSSVIAQLLADGALGDVLSVSADFGGAFPFDPLTRWWNPALAGGALLDIGVYPAAFAHFVLGAPSTVTARGVLASTGVDAQSTVVLDYAGSQARSVLTSSMLVSTNTAAAIAGTEARVEISGPFFCPAPFSFVPAEGDPIQWADTSGITLSDGLCYEAAAVAQHIADGLTESPLHGLDDTIAVLEVLDAARAQLGAA